MIVLLRFSLLTVCLEGLSLTLELAEIHLLKTEYSQAREIYAEVVETTSADQYPAVYANALRNIALIDITTGCTASVSKSLSTAKDIYETLDSPDSITYCNTIQADMEL